MCRAPGPCSGATARMRARWVCSLVARIAVTDRRSRWGGLYVEVLGFSHMSIYRVLPRCVAPPLRFVASKALPLYASFPTAQKTFVCLLACLLPWGQSDVIPRRAGGQLGGPGNSGVSPRLMTCRNFTDDAERRGYRPCGRRLLWEGRKLGAMLKCEITICRCRRVASRLGRRGKALPYDNRVKSTSTGWKRKYRAKSNKTVTSIGRCRSEHSD
jgi:hypothetical protein